MFCSCGRKGDRVTRIKPAWKRVISGVYRFDDICNVYLIKKGTEAIVFDFGSGAWQSSLEDIGVSRVRHVFLTHAHRDQVAGLSAKPTWPFVVHASDQDLSFYQPGHPGHLLEVSEGGRLSGELSRTSLSPAIRTTRCQVCRGGSPGRKRESVRSPHRDTHRGRSPT
ncbi:MAG: hypothetical protein CME25_05460 [Gemmatimonadetes bacterium]|nr:hypothetical protein [Gemmatimonadota bacterium]